MAEIGAMLREARIRARIDISEIEARTKIRAKYLRALENEEWDMLPGPTYVKSFLRTYAAALGLDSKLLVEEYKLRHERLSEMEMQPIMAGGPGPSPRERYRPGPGFSGWWLIGGGAAMIVAVLAVVGLVAGTGTSHHARTASPAHKGQPAAGTGPTGPAAAVPVRRRRVRLQVIPTGAVYVCLQAASGRRIIDGRILAPGAREPTFHSRRFRITVGNGSVLMKVNGKQLTVPGPNASSYVITPAGRRNATAAQAPRCSM
jgi:hypothetical protein